MPNFLALSRELRDLIYIFVLNAPDDPPPSSPANSGERQQANDEARPGCKIYYSHRVHVSSAALLLTNRQIHAEFAACIARLKKSGRLRYKLDCMLYEEEAIYPTWLSVPVMSARVDLLEVDLRLFGHPDEEGHEYMNYWKADHGGASPVLWSLWALLDRFLDCGPDFLSRAKDGQKIEVDRLVLNVIDTSDPDEDRIPGYDRSRDNIMHSEHVLSEMRIAVDVLLGSSTFSELIYERVSSIRLCDEGHFYRSWDLGVMPVRITTLEEFLAMRKAGQQ